MMFNKLFTKNEFVKPLAVVTVSTPSVIYLLNKSSKLFNAQPVSENPDMVTVSTELVKSFQGALILLVLLISFINMYKPPKIVVFSLVLGGTALLASTLLQTIGMTFLIYGLSLMFNSMTLNKTIERNNKLSIKQQENEIDQIIREVK